MENETKTETENGTETGIDFASEMQKVKEASTAYLKLTEGANTVHFLDNGGAIHIENINGNDVEKRDFKVEHDGSKKIYSITTGGKTSLYGQLIAYGFKHGCLKDKSVMIQRFGTSKTDTRYSVLDTTANSDTDTKTKSI